MMKHFLTGFGFAFLAFNLFTSSASAATLSNINLASEQAGTSPFLAKLIDQGLLNIEDRTLKRNTYYRFYNFRTRTESDIARTFLLPHRVYQNRFKGVLKQQPQVAKQDTFSREKDIRRQQFQLLQGERYIAREQERF